MNRAPYIKLLAEIPHNMTKGELARLTLPSDMTFDYAIPQGFANQFKGEAYERIVSQCVTCYPKRNIFGEIINLVTGEIMAS